MEIEGALRNGIPQKPVLGVCIGRMVPEKMKRIGREAITKLPDRVVPEEDLFGFGKEGSQWSGFSLRNIRDCPFLRASIPGSVPTRRGENGKREKSRALGQIRTADLRFRKM